MLFMNEKSAGRILETLLSRGGDFGEIYCQANQYTRIQLDDGKLEEIVCGEDAGVSLRLISDDRTFFYSGNSLAVETLVEEAARLARTLGEGCAPGSLRPLQAREVPKVSPVRIPPATVDQGRKVEQLRRAEKAAREHSPSVVQFSASYGDSTVDVA